MTGRTPAHLPTVTVHALQIADGGPQDGWARLLPLLAPAERSRAASLAPAHAPRFVFGRALLRQVLGPALGMHPSAVPIEVTDTGKPTLPPSMATVGFNVSHSGPYVVVAVSPDGAVGVDVEPVRPVDERLVRRFLTSDEQRRLPPPGAPGYDEAVVHLWVVKEACLKAEGTTLGRLPTIEATPGPAGRHGTLHWAVVPVWPRVVTVVARPAPRRVAPPSPTLMRVDPHDVLDRATDR